MTGRDPAVQAAMDRAARELARRVALVAGLADPDAWARDYVEHLHAEGWRPWPRSDRIPDTGHADPDVTHRGAQKARELLARRQHGPYRPDQGDTDGS